jgi:hypothetical protein
MRKVPKQGMEPTGNECGLRRNECGPEASARINDCEPGRVLYCEPSA